MLRYLAPSDRVAKNVGIRSNRLMTTTIAFFNHKGGVGKTTMLFNLAVEMGRLKKRILMMDMDSQANLTAISLEDSILATLYSTKPSSAPSTVADAFDPLVSGAGDFVKPGPIEIRKASVWLVPGDIRLTAFESVLPAAWTESLAGLERGFRITSAPYRLTSQLAGDLDADYVFVDLGPNVGALNRAVLLGIDYLILPLASDLFSLRALPSVGASMDAWVSTWKVAVGMYPMHASMPMPRGEPKVLGYVTQQFNIYGGVATKAFQSWIKRMPAAVESGLLVPMRKHPGGPGTTLADPADGKPQLGELKNYHSLVPHAQSLRKAIFELETDEVIFGNQLERAKASESDFRALCDEIIHRT